MAKFGRLILAIFLCLGLVIACGKNGGSTQSEISLPGSVEELLASQPEPVLLANNQPLPSPGFYEVTSRGQSVQILLIAEDENYLRLHFRFPAEPEPASATASDPAILRPPLGRFSANQPWAIAWSDEVLWLYTSNQGLVSLHPDVRRKSVNSSLRNPELDQQQVPASVMTAMKQ